jgi:selenocysteine-specific elongation factor
LLRDKVLIKVDDDIVFHRNALDDLRRRLAEYKMRSPRITIAQFKELAGVTRRYAMALLEYLDQERVTHRAGDERIIL